MDPDDRYTASTNAVTICGQHNETSDTSDCTSQTYDIVDTCMYDDLQAPDNETEAMLICQNANVDESTCIAETYESSSLPVSCVFTSAQVDGGTCVSATPSDQDAANLACGAASSSRHSCLSATYVDSLMEYHSNTYSNILEYQHSNTDARAQVRSGHFKWCGLLVVHHNNGRCDCS